MNSGRDLTLIDLTGIEISDPSSNFPEPGSYYDHGIGRISIPTGQAQAVINSRFPVPPQFT